MTQRVPAWIGCALLLLATAVPRAAAQEGGTTAAPAPHAPAVEAPAVPATQPPETAPPAEAAPAAETSAEEASAARTPSPAAGLQVDEAVICRDVADREPVEPGTLFPADAGKLYCFTRVLGAEGEVTIHHVWYWNDRKMADVPLVVRSPRFRTYSSKRILPSWTGAWRVEITGPQGEPLATAAFDVR